MKLTALRFLTFAAALSLFACSSSKAETSTDAGPDSGPLLCAADATSISCSAKCEHGQQASRACAVVDGQNVATGDCICDEFTCKQHGEADGSFEFATPFGKSDVRCPADLCGAQVYLYETAGGAPFTDCVAIGETGGSLPEYCCPEEACTRYAPDDRRPGLGPCTDHEWAAYRCPSDVSIPTVNGCIGTSDGITFCCPENFGLTLDGGT